MIDPEDALDVQVKKQAKIIDALLKRSNRERDVGGSAYSLFQSAITLQGEVWEKTKDLEQALDTLGRTSSDLRKAEFAREQTKKNLGDALEAMEGGFALFNDGKLQIYNDLFRDLIPDLVKFVEPGLDFNYYFEAVSRSEFVHRDPKINRLPVYDEHTSKHSRSKAPYVLALKNDRWFQITHRPTGSGSVVVLLTEITEIVRANRSEKDRLIDEQSVFLQAAFDHMQQGICTFSATGQLLIHNARFGELLALPWSLTNKGSDIARIFAHVKSNPHFAISETLESDNLVLDLKSDGQLSYRIRCKDGQRLDVQAYLLPDGGFIVNVLDVTAESHTKELLETSVRERTSALTEANNQLRSQRDAQAEVEEKLRLSMEEAQIAISSKTRFLAAASHDLLQPINAAKLLISTLGEQAQGSGFEKNVSRLERSFSLTESLLHALLDISRLDSTGAEFSVTTFGIDEILTSIEEEYTPVAKEKNIELKIVHSSVGVESDQRYLLRSIQNLVVNAIQYTETGRVLVGVRRREDIAVVEIWDTGIGIPKKDQLRIFSEFTRIEPSAPGYGMGLGLSIVERACRHLGHKVSVRSMPGKGSVFSIELKCTGVVERSENESSQNREHQPQEDMDLIVVIVENDPDVLFATVQKLESWGASVLAASSSDEAVHLIRDIGMPPDIILADYQLNDGDTGEIAIKRMREEAGEKIPAIMITANRDESLVTSGRENDFTVLTKPVQLSRLRPLIDWETRARSTE